MAVHMMVSEDKKGQPNVKTVENFPGTKRTLYIETTYVGCVISLRERNGYHDSDFYATVWDVKEQKPKEIMYATTRGWSYPNGADVDALPEIQAAYDAHQKAYKANRTARAALAAVEYEKIAKNIVRPGDYVRVIRGRKVPKGTEGFVTWIGLDNWNVKKAGIKDAEGKVHYVPVSYVELKMGDDWVPDATKDAAAFIDRNHLKWDRWERRWYEVHPLLWVTNRRYA